MNDSHVRESFKDLILLSPRYTELYVSVLKSRQLGVCIRFLRVFCDRVLGYEEAGIDFFF